VAEGARLESVFRGNSNVGSNPTLSASNSRTPHHIKSSNALGAGMVGIGRMSLSRPLRREPDHAWLCALVVLKAPLLGINTACIPG
jgi:hypothetical protein